MFTVQASGNQGLAAWFPQAQTGTEQRGDMSGVDPVVHLARRNGHLWAGFVGCLATVWAVGALDSTPAVVVLLSASFPAVLFHLFVMGATVARLQTLVTPTTEHYPLFSTSLLARWVSRHPRLSMLPTYALEWGWIVIITVALADST